MSHSLDCDVLIVGAGYAGAIVAERLASQAGLHCLVIDRRHHIAGNSYDAPDASGVLLHQYGPHYFRTNSDAVREYLSRFTEWHPVEYKILSWSDGRYWQFPINLNTYEQFLNLPPGSATSEQMAADLEKWRVPIDQPANSEEVIISQVGWPLYEKFFRNYTRKQWRRDPRDLDASVCGRIPIRTNRDDRYLQDKFQAIPREGYTAMFRRILAHPKIEVRLGLDFRDLRETLRRRHTVFTGMIDEYFDFAHGRLPYRSLRFEPESLLVRQFQPVMQVNYPNDHDYTRIVEIKHATGQEIDCTTIVREYPDDYSPEKEAYYPIPAPDAEAIYRTYDALKATAPNVSFIGRLATYRYYNMDQIAAMALKESDRIRNILAG